MSIETQFHPKGILLDIDGTITASDKKVSPATAQTLLQIASMDIPCGVSTGRHFAAIKGYILPFFSPNAVHITAGGGQLVRSSGEILWEECLNSTQVRSIITNVEQFGGSIICGDNKTLYCSENLIEQLHAHPWEIPVQPIPSQIIKTPLLSVLKLSPQVRSYIESLPGLTVKLMGSDPETQYFDITAKDTTKASTAKRWCELYHITMSDLLAVGDNTNDLELLEGAGMGVAMGDAPQHVKDVARKTIGRTNDDGLATFLRQMLHLKSSS